MLFDVLLKPGLFRWWLAPLAYVASMGVLIGASVLGVGAEIGQAAVFIGYMLLATVFAFVFARTAAGNELGLLRPANARRVLVVSIIGAATAIAISELAGLIDEDIARSTETVMTSIGFGSSVSTDLLIIVTVCCLAPLGEEALYRGLIFRGLFNSLSTRLPSVFAALCAALLAAVVFALSHGGEGQEATVVAVICLSGLIFGLCYAMAGSLWAAVLAHSINNAVALAVFAFPQDQVSVLNKAVILAAPFLSGALLWGWSFCFPRQGRR